MKLGVFFSRCEGIVGTSLDLEPLADNYAHYDAVQIFENFYDPNDFDELLKTVEKNQLDSLILAGDSPLDYRNTRNGGHLFRCLSDRGVNVNRVEIVNLKNMVAMPHEALQDELQQKARLMIDVGIEKIKCSGKVNTVEISPRKSVAVVGANIAAIAAAQHLLDEGFKVFLINGEKEIDLPARYLNYIRPTFIYVLRHPRFTCYNESVVSDFHGYTGDYTLKIDMNGRDVEILVGAALLSLEHDDSMIKACRYIFHIDVKEDGAPASRDEVSARSQTLDKGVFIINPIQSGEDDPGRMFMAADAAAAMVVDLLSRNEIHHQVMVSQVYKGLCSGCGACVKTCVFHAVSLQGDPPVSVIDPRRCRGCGNCVTVCPSDARDLVVCPSQYLFKAVSILSEFQLKSNTPRVLLIACDGCGYRCLDRAARMGLTWPVGILPLWVVCGGRIDMRLVMQAFVDGFEGVALMICGEGCCHHVIGNVELERRINLFKTIMISRGIETERLAVLTTCSREGEDCVNSINEFYGRIYNRIRKAG